jgi:uncharacterized glyoxalase superfamily protein PhnB
VKDLIPMLITRDLPATIKLYTEQLNFRVTGSLSNDYEMTWVSLKRGNVAIMFTIPFESQKNEAIKLSGSLYIYPENVDELWIELQGKVEIAWPIENFHYGMREFAIKDNNGYLLTFGQEIEIE